MARRPAWLLPAVLAVTLTGAFFLAERRLDFTIGEEGFLWYGAIQTAHGGVPLRDFYSYDPGRYYWAAAWAPLGGDGLLALRFSTAAFAALGLFCGLLAARRAVPSAWALALVGLLLLLWTVPRNKAFEPSLAMAAVLCCAGLVEKPSLARCFAAGVVTGAGAFFGKNHGLYIALSVLLLLGYLSLRSGWAEVREAGGRRSEDQVSGSVRWRDGRLRWGGERLLAWAAGGLAGALPLLLMLLLIPGFALSYVDSIRFFLEAGQTNFALPIPWPWRIAAAGHGTATLYAFGLCFLLLPVLYAGAAVLAWRVGRGEVGRGGHPAEVVRGRPGEAASPAVSGALAGPAEPAAGSRALLAACAAVGLFYMHHAFSRADLHHLAQSIHPFLLGAVALPASLPARFRRPLVFLVAALLAALTLLEVPREHPLYRRLTAERPVDRFIPCRIGGDEICMRAQKVRLLESFVGTVEAQVPAGEPMLVAPQLPGLYAVLGKKAPIWDIYPLWPARGRRDRRMLSELKANDVKWALLEEDFGLDGRADLRFRATHPETWRYLMRRFERQPAPRLSDRWWLLHRKDR